MRTIRILGATCAAVAIASPGALAGNGAGVTFITDTLGGNGRPAPHAPGFHFITDTLGGNGRPSVAARRSPSAFSGRGVGVGHAMMA